MRHHGGSVIGVIVAIGIAIPALIMMFHGFRAAILLLFGSSSDREGHADKSRSLFIQPLIQPVTAEGEDDFLPHHNVNAADRMAS